MSEETRTYKKEQWIYTGIWNMATDGTNAKWLDESGKAQWFGITPKNKSNYKLFVIGGVYEVTTYVDGDKEGMIVSGKEGPVYRKRHTNDEEIAEWQANRISLHAAKEAIKYATSAKDDVLQDAMNKLRKAQASLPIQQKSAFQIWVLNELKRRF